VGNDRGAFAEGLHDQQPIKRVAVVPWQCLDSGCVIERDRQWLSTGTEERPREVGRRLQLAEGSLDGDLP
jgi:hypothetical protein